MSYKLKLLKVAFLLLVFSLVACDDHSHSHSQEEHLEPVAIALINESTGDQLAILFDEESLPDSVSQSNVTIAAGSEVDLEVELLCLHNGALEHCQEEDDHADEEGEDDHIDEEGDHEDEDYSLVVKIANEEVATASVHSGEFAFTLSGVVAGSTELELEIWHGGHADISGKVFDLVVE